MRAENPGTCKRLGLPWTGQVCIGLLYPNLYRVCFFPLLVFFLAPGPPSSFPFTSSVVFPDGLGDIGAVPQGLLLLPLLLPRKSFHRTLPLVGAERKVLGLAAAGNAGKASEEDE